jgi:alpha-tubulin suppressor-like RCC1 family protein
VALLLSPLAPASLGSALPAGVPNKGGAVWTWGDYNIFGRGSPALVQVPRIAGVVGLAVGRGGGGDTDDTDYALGSDGTVWAWGTGTDGELGNGTTPGTASAPVKVHGLDNVVAIAAGGDTAYALDKDGSVWAWGTSFNGALGNGAKQASSDVPVRVHGLADVVAIAAGGDTAYALAKDGTVWAWGLGQDGQLGNGTRAAQSDVPVQVHGLSDVVTVAGSDSDGYAVRKDGTVWAWGGDKDGQLGNGTRSAGSDVPVQVHRLTDVAAVAGFNATDSVIALTKDGTVWHWGAVVDAYSKAPGDDVPAPVLGLSGAVAIAGGYYTEFAVLRDGALWAWGDDEDGEMGNCTAALIAKSLCGLHAAGAYFASAPVQVPGLHGVVGVAGGYAEELAVVAPKTG